MFLWLFFFILSSLSFLIICYYAFILLLNYKWDTPKRNYELGKILPGPKTLPVIGLSLSIASLKPDEMFDFAAHLLKNHKPFVSFRNIGYLLTLTIDPNHVEEILKSTKYIHKGLEYFAILPWLGTGLLTSKGDKWFSRRKMLTPTFHFQILEQYLPIINQNARELSNTLNGQLFGNIDLISYISRTTLNIIVETAMGTKLNSKEGEIYIQAVNKACGLVVKRAQNPALISNFLFHISWTGYQTRKCLRVLHRFTENVIKERREEYYNDQQSNQASSRKRKAFLDYLIEMSEEGVGSMTDLDIREEVDTFMFEGHDTTAMSISWTLFLLGGHPEIQDRVVSEINEIFDTVVDDELTSDHLKKMEYLEKVIKEGLRLYPSVPYMSRWLENDLVLGEYTIPAQSNIGIFNYLLHRNPDIYPDPEKFDPERFSKENCSKRHPFAYIPFSAGPRNCIGQRFALMEEKIVIAQLLRKYKLEAVTKREEIKCTPHVILRPMSNQLLVRITPR